jgi:protease-4
VPIFAYVDGTCASGGMYISSAADKIYSSPISIIGSVGVILGPVFNFHQLMENWGIQTKTISKGKDKAMLNPFTVWKPNEDASLHAITEYLYTQFVDIVLAARPQMNREKLIEEYGAQVFAAPKALEYGYVDSASASYSSTLKVLVSASGIKEAEKYQVIELRPGKPFLSGLFDSKSSNTLIQSLEKLLGISAEVQELKDPFLYLYSPF